jgi:hypothetical protein
MGCRLQKLMDNFCPDSSATLVRTRQTLESLPGQWPANGSNACRVYFSLCLSLQGRVERFVSRLSLSPLSRSLSSCLSRRNPKPRTPPAFPMALTPSIFPGVSRRPFANFYSFPVTHTSLNPTGVARLSKTVTPLVGPYRRPVLRVLWDSQGGGPFPMSEVSLYSSPVTHTFLSPTGVPRFSKNATPLRPS